MISSLNTSTGGPIAGRRGGKARENRIRATALTVMRCDGAELMEPGTLERKLAAAGLSRRRTRFGARKALTLQ